MAQIEPLNHIKWTRQYPNPKTIKKEIDVMCNIVMRTLLKIRSTKEIKGIYLKGSANKRWDSIIDYVPEISDIDIHVLFWRDSIANNFCTKFDEALKIKCCIEEDFHQAIRRPIHIPRPQIMVINHIKKTPNYEPSPPETVKILYGEKYPTDNFSYQRPFKKAYIKMILTELSGKNFLAKYPMQIVDKPGKYNFTSLRLISWRISAIGPVILALHNIPRKVVWALNHTGVCEKLMAIGCRKLARDYVSFYKECWRCFLCHYQDDAAASTALTSGVNVLRQAIIIAREIRN